MALFPTQDPNDPTQQAQYPDLSAFLAGDNSGAATPQSGVAALLQAAAPILSQPQGAQPVVQSADPLAQNMPVDGNDDDSETADARGKGGAAAAQNALYPEGTTIKNPTTGERQVMQGGKWISLGTPQMARTLPPQDASYLEAARTQASKMRQIANLADEFSQYNAKSGTGGELGLPLIGTGIADVESKYAPDHADIGAMQSLTKRMIPLQREKGAGPIRMGEIMGMGGGIFGGDVPRVENPGDTNANIHQQWKREAAASSDYVNFLDQYASTHGTISGADAAYQQQIAQKARPWQSMPVTPQSKRQQQNAALQAQSAKANGGFSIAGAQ